MGRPPQGGQSVLHFAPPCTRCFRYAKVSFYKSPSWRLGFNLQPRNRLFSAPFEPGVSARPFRVRGRFQLFPFPAR